MEFNFSWVLCYIISNECLKNLGKFIVCFHWREIILHHVAWKILKKSIHPNFNTRASLPLIERKESIKWWRYSINTFKNFPTGKCFFHQKKSNELCLCYWLFVVYNWFKVSFTWNYWVEWIVSSCLIGELFQTKHEPIKCFTLISFISHLKGQVCPSWPKADPVFFPSLLIVSWSYEGCKRPNKTQMHA